LHPATSKARRNDHFKVGSETFKTSYTIFGDLKSGTRPLVTVVLNGGPGISHSYMLPHANLYRQRGEPVVLYNQLGTGESMRLRDKPTSFITPTPFVAELNNLLGQSWSITLGAVEYIAAHRPAGLKRLVLTSGPASFKMVVSERH